MCLKCPVSCQAAGEPPIIHLHCFNMELKYGFKLYFLADAEAKSPTLQQASIVPLGV